MGADLKNNKVNSSITGEVTLIGTGGGYGESIIINLGENNWMVVDSCVNPKTKKSLPLEYLESQNVDIKNDVKIIVITHWHDDHISGISELYGACEKADLFIGQIGDMTKFLYFVGYDYTKVKTHSSMSSTKEFKACVEILKKRVSRQLKISLMDRTLKVIQLSDNLFSKVVSLSPSDYAVELFTKQIGSLITEFGENPNKKLKSLTPNDNSVVLIVSLGEHHVLLGADLEVSSDKRLGWINILDNSNCLKKATLFKPAHHGSENGNHDRIWDELLDERPLSKLTPYNKGHKLPTIEMLKLIKDKSEKLFITSPVISDKKANPKKRDIRIRKLIDRVAKDISEVKYSFGRVTCKIDIQDPKAVWEIETEGSSLEISS